MGSGRATGQGVAPRVDSRGDSHARETRSIIGSG